MRRPTHSSVTARILDRVVFEHVVGALVHGSRYERIASSRCSDRTIRRRLRDWAEAGLAEELHALVFAQYDRMIGLELDDVAIDGCVTEAPCGGEKAGRSPVDRGKQGLKRSVATDGSGVPLHVVAAGANRPDGTLLESTLGGVAALGLLPTGVAARLDRGYDSAATRGVLAAMAVTGVIARNGVPAPIAASQRWVVERTHAWMNGFGKLRRCTDRDGRIIDFYLSLAAALVTTRCLIHRARTRYRWDTRPTTRRLK